MRISVLSVWQTALAGAILLAGGCAFEGPAHAQDDGSMGAGTFLVAPRRAADPSFAGTVVLLVRMDDSGALGLVINRPTDVPVSTLLQNYKPARRLKDHAFSGGPVQQESLLALYRSARKIEDASLVFQDVYLVSTPPALEHIFGLKPNERNLRVYMGYTGWGPGQLQHEMDLNVWRVLPADADTVFAADPAAVWQRLIERTELRYALNMRR